MYSALNTFSEYTYFHITKNITSYTFLLVFKVESLAFSVSLKKLYVSQQTYIPVMGGRGEVREKL